MPEVLRALLVVLLIATGVFSISKKLALEGVISVDDFKLRRNLWFFITIVLFLAHNFWIFIALVALVVAYTARANENRLALFFFLLFAAPLFSEEISGLGIVNFLFEINYLRMLCIIILLPAFLSLRKSPTNDTFRLAAPDLLLSAYLLLTLIRQIQIDSATNTARTAFYLFVDVCLPYYVASRSIRDFRAFKDVLFSFIVASAIIGLVGIFELIKGWLLFSSVNEALGVDWEYGKYLLRGDAVRAQATAGQPIVLGYILSVAVGFYFFIGPSFSSKWMRAVGLMGLIAGLVAPLSRGPWIGAAVSYVVYTMTGVGATKNLLKVLTFVGGISFLLLFTPYASIVIDHLPFIGTIDVDNVEYRDKLLVNSLEVISRNLYFGSYDYMLAPEMEQLRSGGDNGIIDVVNSYLGIALSGGIVALALFTSFFLVTLVGVTNTIRGLSSSNLELRALGRMLIATLSGILVTIYTVSSITFIPVIYWATAGLSLSYIRLVAESKRNSTHKAPLNHSLPLRH